MTTKKLYNYKAPFNYKNKINTTSNYIIYRLPCFPATHHLNLEVHHLLVQRRLSALNLLDPLGGDQQQNMSLCL